MQNRVNRRFPVLLIILATLMVAHEFLILCYSLWSHLHTEVRQREHHSSDTFRIASDLPVDMGVLPLPEKRHIVFLKVHKAASTTVQNILLRFGLGRNLSAMLVTEGTEINETGTLIDPKAIVPHPPGIKFDILTNHIVFDRREIDPYFSHSTVFVGIVREPFQLFRSAFIYYSQVWKHRDLLQCISDNPTDPIGHFLRQPPAYSSDNPRLSYVNNRMAVDFGFPPQHFELAKRERQKIEAFVAQILRTFSLILIADRFDESMILFKRYMNWQMKDILYLKQNVFKDKNGTGNPQNEWMHRRNYSQEELSLFSSWAVMDMILYKKSLQAFQEKIEKEVEFQEELDTFRDLRRSVAAFCKKVTTIKTKASASPLVIPANDWTREFEVSRKDCQLMAMEEISLVDFVRQEQLRRWNISLKALRMRVLDKNHYLSLNYLNAGSF